MADLDVAFAVHTPTGWIELEDPVNGYELHTESFAARSVSHRKNEVSNNWIPGEYNSRAVRTNVVEDVGFFVGGSTAYECRMRAQAVTEAFDSLHFQARMRIEDYQETWECTTSDYVLESNQPLIVAKLVLVRAKVSRHPQVYVEQVVAP